MQNKTLKTNKSKSSNAKKNLPQKIIKDLNQLKMATQSIQRKSGSQNLMNRSMKLSKSQLLEKYQAFQMSYARSIVLPEFSRGAKLPSIFPQPTASMHKHITVPITTSVNGKAAIVWQPYVMQDTGATPYSGLYVNNSATLTLTAPEVTTGYQVLPTPWGVPANVYSSYRLVSASVRIDPQMSLQTAQGSIAGGIAVYANQAGYHAVGVNQFIFSGDLTVASNVDNCMYFNKANITEQQSIRHIFFPLDPTYEFYTPINYPHGYSASTTENNTDFYFAYYITGAPASSSFNLELYLNFECMPTPTALAYLPTNTYVGKEDSSKIIKSVTSKPGAITQSSSNISEQLLFEDSDFLSVNSTESKGSSNSWMSDVSGFISEHGSSIMGLARSVASLF